MRKKEKTEKVQGDQKGRGTGRMLEGQEKEGKVRTFKNRHRIRGDPEGSEE